MLFGCFVENSQQPTHHTFITQNHQLSYAVSLITHIWIFHVWCRLSAPMRNGLKQMNEWTESGANKIWIKIICVFFGNRMLRKQIKHIAMSHAWNSNIFGCATSFNHFSSRCHFRWNFGICGGFACHMWTTNMNGIFSAKYFYCSSAVAISLSLSLSR